MSKLIIQNQGHVNSGWRYSPKKGQEQLLDLIVDKLPQWVSEVKPLAVWWKVFTPEDEQLFLADVKKLLAGNFKIQTGGSPISKNPYVGSLVDEALDEMDESEEIRPKVKEIVESLPGFDKNKIFSELAGEFYKPEKLEWLGSKGAFALVYFPVLQTTRNYEKIYFHSKVVKVNLATMEQEIVFDGSTRQRLGKLRRQELIKEELG